MAAGEERRKHALILSRVRGLQRQRNAEASLRALALPLWSAASAVGAYRLLVGVHLAAVCAALLATALGWWVARTRRRGLALADAAVMADRFAGAGGLLLTRLEVPLGEWELPLNTQVRRATFPPARWGRPGMAILGALLFLAVTLAIPLPPPRLTRINAAAAGKVAEVEAKAEALAEEKPLDEAWKTEFERLRQEAAADRFDGKDWESADALEGALDKQAAKTAAELATAREAAKVLEDKLGAAQGEEAASREREELERALAQLGEKPGGDPSADLKPQASPPKPGEKQTGAAAPKASAGDRRSVSELRKALQDRQQKLANAFNQAKSNAQAQSGAKGPGAEGKPGPSAGTTDPESGAPAPVHGPGKGHLRFGEVPELHPERLKFQPLPPGQGGEQKELWGLRAANPQVNDGPAVPHAVGALAPGERAASNASRGWLPKNRELVRRYFDSPR